LGTIEKEMKRRSFKNGQILYCLYHSGKVGMCVFEKRENDKEFLSTNLTKFNPDGSIYDSFITSDCSYRHNTHYIQWQLATMEQIKKYGYEKHYTDRTLQFREFYPEFQPEKEGIDNAIALLKANGYRISKKTEQWIEV
jgi:hypothetical protein